MSGYPSKIREVILAAGQRGEIVPDRVTAEGGFLHASVLRYLRRMAREGSIYLFRYRRNLGTGGAHTPIYRLGPPPKRYRAHRPEPLTYDKLCKRWRRKHRQQVREYKKMVRRLSAEERKARAEARRNEIAQRRAERARKIAERAQKKLESADPLSAFLYGRAR